MSLLKRHERDAFSERQNHRCCYCGVRFGEGLAALTIDHVVPRSAGSGNRRANFVAACLRCNGLRGNEDALSFFERKGWDRRHPQEPFLPTPTVTWGLRPRRTLADVWPSAAA
jgi:5-methylcytosine-specific restriction endonuclease McrA